MLSVGLRVTQHQPTLKDVFHSPGPIKLALCVYSIKLFVGKFCNLLIYMVGVTGIEPATPASRRQCSTRLSYTPNIKNRQALKRFPDLNVCVEWRNAPNL